MFSIFFHFFLSISLELNRIRRWSSSSFLLSLPFLPSYLSFPLGSGISLHHLLHFLPLKGSNKGMNEWEICKIELCISHRFQKLWVDRDFPFCDRFSPVFDFPFPFLKVSKSSRKSESSRNLIPSPLKQTNELNEWKKDEFELLLLLPAQKTFFPNRKIFLLKKYRLFP